MEELASVPEVKRIIKNKYETKRAFDALVMVLGNRPHSHDSSKYNNIMDGLEYVLQYLEEKVNQEMAAKENT